MQEQTDIIKLRGQEDEMEIDLVELLYYFRSKILWIISAFIIGAVGMGLITYFLITPEYEANSKIYMVSASSDSVVNLTDLNLGDSLSSDYAELLKTRPIFEDVIKNLELDYTYEELLEMVTITTVNDTRILQVTVESPDAEEAMRVANELADQSVSKLPDLMDTSTPNIAEYAIKAESPSSPSYTINIMAGALVLMLLVLAVLTFNYVTDDTFKSAEDVESAFGIMPLTVIPESDIGELSEKKEKEGRKRSRFKKVKRLINKRRSKKNIEADKSKKR
ncbi:Wzz/FepE/Etk N-terminal domain-containing protein [Lachnospiraceae bacterium 48-42]|nr:capsular polysaccharide biosynthesis protein [Dorea sp.]